jgi:hypothetical protein
MNRISLRAQWFAAGAVFVILVAPTIVSYHPYAFRWDDADYLWQAISVSSAFWAGNSHGLARIREVCSAMYGVHPPAMTLLSLPWGAVRTWDAAGDCFVTLACWISLLASVCLYLLARIGVKPLLLILASVCVGAALGPWPASAPAHIRATAFMADGLVGWTSLAALLLIPYELRTVRTTVRHAACHGLLWGLILSLGVMTKISFLYFAGLILPVLVLVRYRRNGWRDSGAAFAGFLIGSGPSALYMAKYGRTSFLYGGASSFGTLSNFYQKPFSTFVRECLRDSPGLWLFAAGVCSALAFIVLKRRSQVFRPDVIAVLIAIGFGLIIMASPNRELRFSFPVILSLPFLLAILLSTKSEPVPRQAATSTAGLAFLVLCVFAWPSRHRADRGDSLARVDAVLARGSYCGDKAILLATDSPTLNGLLFRVALQLTPGPAATSVRDLTGSSLRGAPFAEDFRAIESSDLVVFQDDRAISPPFTNARVPSYRKYIAEQTAFSSLRVGGDVAAFSRHCK